MTRHRPIALAALASLLALSACDDEVTSDACDDHADCADTEVCFSNHCRTAYGQRYLLTIVGASYLPATMPEGGFWDPTGGSPDPYLELVDQDGHTCTSRPATDTASPTWNHECGDTFDILEETRFSWAVYDDDDDEDTEPQLMVASAEGEEFQIFVDWIRASTFSHSSNGVTVHFRLDRR